MHFSILCCTSLIRSPHRITLSFHFAAYQELHVILWKVLETLGNKYKLATFNRYVYMYLTNNAMGLVCTDHSDTSETHPSQKGDASPSNSTGEESVLRNQMLGQYKSFFDTHGAVPSRSAERNPRNCQRNTRIISSRNNLFRRRKPFRVS